MKRFRFVKPLTTLLLLLAVGYLAVSSFVAYSIWHPVGKALHTTPAAYGLEYEDIQFNGAVDSIPLKGWFINSPGTKTVLVMHGSGSVRDNYISMEVSRALVQHHYDVFTL